MPDQRNRSLHDLRTSVGSLGAAIDRRRLLQRLAAGAGALSLSGLLTQRAARAASGGSIVWAKPLETTQIDPHTSILGSSWEIHHIVYDRLTAMDDQLNVIPSVAKSWEQPAPNVYVFNLEEGVTFSNGRPMTAADVVGSIRRIIDPKLGAFWAKQLGPITKVEAVDDRTLRVELETAYAPFLDAISASMVSIMPIAELEAGAFDPAKEMLGTGPFMITEHVENDHWLLKRNPHYWREGLPVVDEVLVRVMPADNARIAALSGGSVDIASFEASPDAALLLQGIPNVEVVSQDSTDLFFLTLNGVWPESPFHDKRLRQAVALTLDREKIRDVGLGGAGQSTAVMAPAFNKCDTSQLGFFKPDIDRAMQLVKEAGAEGLRFELLVRNVQADVQMAQVVKQNVAEIGLDAEIAVLDEGIWVKRAWIDNPSTFQATIFWYAGYSDAAMVPLWWNPKLAGFTAGYIPEDGTMNELIARALTLGREDSNRDVALQDLCSAIDETALSIPLVTRQDTLAYRSDRVEGQFKSRQGYANTVRAIAEYRRISS
jgi:peptide/nickel transport system substrate-binding protein